MKKTLFLTFLFLGYLSVVAQKEVCESEEHQIEDFNSINKCVIDQKEDVNKKEYSSIKPAFLKKKNKLGAIVKRGVVLNKDKKVSIDLIKKILIKEKIDEADFSNTILNK